MSDFLKKPIVLISASLCGYVCAFYVFHVLLGRGMVMAAFVPVVAAAWCFGTLWGGVAALAGMFTNIFLYVALGIEWQQFQGEIFIGTVSTVVVAWIFGHVRAMNLRNRQAVVKLSDQVQEHIGTEKQLRELMLFYENVIESSIDSIVVADEHGNIVRVNRAALELSGFDLDELIGQSHTLLTNLSLGSYRSITGETVTIDDGFLSQARALQNQIAETGRIAGWEHYIVRKDGHLVPVEGNVVVLRNDAGQIIGSLGISRDISGRRQTEQELERHRAHLHDMVQDKTAALQAREHELRATNQQLTAANEQLQSANKQLRQSEQALRESEERFRAFVQLANEAIVIIDDKGSVISWNRGAEKIYGYSEQEILSRPVFTLVPEEERQVHEGRLATMTLSNDMPGMQAPTDGRGLRKDGTVFPLSFSITRWDTSGTMMYGFIVRDITARKKDEAELRALNETLRDRNEQLQASQRAFKQSEQQFRTLVETMNEGVVVTDSQGCFSYINERVCEILGYSREALLGQTLEPFLTEESREILREQVEQRRQGSHQAYEMTWVRSDGTRVITSISPRSIFDEQRQFQGSFAVITDITTQKRLQQQQRESREFLENIFRTTNDGIVVSKTDGTIIMANATIEKLLGYDEGEMNGVSALSFVPQEGDFRQRGLEMAALLRREGSVQNWETEWCRKDGSRVPVEINVTFLRDREGNPTGAVAAVRDISERRAIEQHLLQAEKLKSLGEMASGVAHDFNNMLTAILGRAQLAKRMLSAAEDAADVDRDPEVKKGLDVIEAAALDGAETVRRIQDFSRVSSNQRFFGSVDIAEVISGALEYTRVRWKDDAELKGLQYHIENMLTEPVMVVGNAAELREVFTNFINNSLDAMPQGGTLSFSADCDAQTVAITVRDTGTGIPQEIINRVFDPFFTTKGPQSSGLGMSVSYGILSRHNGTVSVSSEEGSGVTLTVTLPLGQPERRVRPDIEPDSQGAGLHVLVIDDDEDVREVLVEMLMSAGHRVESAGDGPAGIEMFRDTAFDLVFTDLGMPGMSGWDVAREIKNMREEALLALVTGWDVQNQTENIEQHSIDFIVNKPFQVTQIMDVMNMARNRLNGTY